MKRKSTLASLAVAAALLVPFVSSQACFTIIVGKNLSATGEILVGHNEDNGDRIMSNQYWVPAATHKAGESVQYEPGSASIPQVERTFGFWWQQTLHPDGYAYSDGFFNENGVLVTSNNCGQTIEKGEAVRDGGIGYGIRRLIAERAVSARDAVRIAIELATRYGYRHQGRTYTIADRNEAWQLALVRGGRYLARKVKDDEMTMMSNAFSLGAVDLKDKDNVIASPDLVEHAIAVGSYKPAKAGDCSDFNFRNAYHIPERMTLDWNVIRLRTAIKHLLGKDLERPYDHPEAMTVAPDRKIGVEDVREILRLQSPWDARTSGWQNETFRDICNGGTFDSAVYVMAKDPLLSYTWRTSGRPNAQFSYPQFLLAGPAAAQSYMSPEEATRAQFRSRPDHFDYSADRTVFSFVHLQNFLDWDQRALRRFAAAQKAFEAQAADDLDTALAGAAALSGVCKERALLQMREFNVASFRRTLGATEAEIASHRKCAIGIAAKELKRGGEGTVDVTLFSTKKVDATRLDRSKTWFGDGYPTEDLELRTDRAKPEAIQFADVNGDGLKDAVITFPVKGATAGTFAGVRTQLYLWTRIDGEPVMAYDTVRIVK